MGLCAAILLHAWFFQTYQNWAFEQELEGEPVSIGEFLAEAVPLMAPSAPTVAPLATAGGRVQTIGFRITGERSFVGRLEIPRIGLKAMVLEGVSQRTLAVSVGHIPGTELPGGNGNVGLAGHRDTFFRELKSVRSGDTILLTTFDGSFEYRVKSCEVVGPHDTRVLKDSGESALTLVTCYPFHYVGPAPERFIVHATRAGS
jgi:LPXTG-site transpeptidase (sortase) family protein